MVANLCFHGIGEPGRALEPDEGQYWVQLDQFDELVSAIRRFPNLRVTFDDGNASDAEIALPALTRAGLRAAFFVVAGRLGEPGSLRADDVRQLAGSGMTVGCHGLRHRSWRSLDDAALQEELVDARGAIAEAAGQSVDEAACPFGAYDRRVLRVLKEKGFRRVYNVDERPARADAWLQARYTIRDSDTPKTIERLGRGEGSGVVGSASRSLRHAVKRWR